MALCSLVGKISYRYLYNLDLDTWMHNTWRPILGYIPSLSHLGQGWLHFQFNSPEDSIVILERFWILKTIA